MRKLIYLIRHGQTDYNLKGIVQGGSVDTDLNDTGRQQANLFFEAYKNIAFDKIYTSSLKRTAQSVERFIKSAIPHQTFSELNEISWGIMDGKIANDKDNQFYWTLVNKWNSGDMDAKEPSGESPKEVQYRLQSAMNYIEAQNHEKNIIICMHGRAMRILLTSLMKLPLEKMEHFEHQNLCLYLLEYQNKEYKILKENDVSHLRV